MKLTRKLPGSRADWPRPRTVCGIVPCRGIRAEDSRRTATWNAARRRWRWKRPANHRRSGDPRRAGRPVANGPSGRPLGSCTRRNRSPLIHLFQFLRKFIWLAVDPEGGVAKMLIAGFGVDEFWMFLYRSIALWMFFLKSFGCNLIGWSVEAVEIMQMSAKLRDRVQGYFVN